MTQGDRVRDDLEELALEYLAQLVGVPSSLLSRDSDVTTLGLSSSQVMELVYKVEDELGIVLADGDLMSISTIGELLDLARHVANVGAGGPS